jgi:hypothetical protein
MDQATLICRGIVGPSNSGLDCNIWIALLIDSLCVWWCAVILVVIQLGQVQFEPVTSNEID